MSLFNKDECFSQMAHVLKCMGDEQECGLRSRGSCRCCRSSHWSSSSSWCCLLLFGWLSFSVVPWIPTERVRAHQAIGTLKMTDNLVASSKFLKELFPFLIHPKGERHHRNASSTSHRFKCIVTQVSSSLDLSIKTLAVTFGKPLTGKRFRTNEDDDLQGHTWTTIECES